MTHLEPADMVPDAVLYSPFRIVVKNAFNGLA
jgi:hypothetical protein